MQKCIICITSVIFNRVEGTVECKVYSKFGKIWMKNVAATVMTRKLLDKKNKENKKNEISNNSY